MFSDFIVNMVNQLLFRVTSSTPFYDEPKFLVFYSMLVQLFTMVCFKCKSADESKPNVTLKRNGTMVNVHQHCPKCGQDAFV